MLLLLVTWPELRAKVFMPAQTDVIPGTADDEGQDTVLFSTTRNPCASLEAVKLANAGCGMDKKNKDGKAFFLSMSRQEMMP